MLVLEFWATWCGPCVASLPHLNELAASLDPAQFQFISVDDEAPKVVETFLGKRKMAGWAGIDTTGSVYAWYGVKERPATIIVGKDGRIVAATQVESVEASALRAVAQGKSVKFPSLETTASMPVPKAAATPQPLFEISLTKALAAKPSDQMLQALKDVPPSVVADILQWGNMSDGPGYLNIDGRSAEKLLLTAYDIPKDRLIVNGTLPEGLFNLHAVWATGEGWATEEPRFAPFLQESLSDGLNVGTHWMTVTKKAYVLKTTDAGTRLLTPTAVTNGSRMSTPYWKGRLRFLNEPIDELAKGLEGAFGVPVVNETGIEGGFDVDLAFPAEDMNAAKAALLQTLGLELIEADRPIPMLETEPPKNAAASAGSRQEARP